MSYIFYAADYILTGPVLPSDGGNENLSAVTGGNCSNANKKLADKPRLAISAIPFNQDT
jgi:hypothetical protein